MARDGAQWRSRVHADETRGPGLYPGTQREGLFSAILSDQIQVKRLPFAYLALPGTHFYLVDRLYNAGTYLRDFFVDFGLAGILAGPFVLGFVTTLLFGKLRFTLTLRNALLYSIAATMITFTFWYNEFTRIQFWYFMAVIWLVDRFLIKRPRFAHKRILPREGFAPDPRGSQ